MKKLTQLCFGKPKIKTIVNTYNSISKFSSKSRIYSQNSFLNQKLFYQTQIKHLFGRREKEDESKEEVKTKEKDETKDAKESKETKEDNKETKETKEETISFTKFNELKTLYEESEENLKKARTKFDELRKAYLADQSDLERIRSRTEKEVSNAKEFAITKFAKDIVEVNDNFDRALSSLKNIEIQSSDDKITTYSNFSEGVIMTKASLNRILNSHGVVEFSPLKQKFDPNLHEAMAQIPSSSDDMIPGTISDVIQSGFMIGKRVLRPAKVAVFKK